MQRSLNYHKKTFLILLVIWVLLYLSAELAMSGFIDLYTYEIGIIRFNSFILLKNFQFLSLVLWSSIAIISGVWRTSLDGFSYKWAFLLIIGLTSCVYWIGNNYYLSKQSEPFLDSMATAEEKLTEWKEEKYEFNKKS